MRLIEIGYCPLAPGCAQPGLFLLGGNEAGITGCHLSADKIPQTNDFFVDSPKSVC